MYYFEKTKVKNSKIYKGDNGVQDATKFYTSLSKDKKNARIIVLNNKLYGEFGSKLGLKMCKK